MLAKERKKLIWETILQEKSILSKDLCRKFNVTNETVRKDLIELENEGKIIRAYGGAYIIDGVQNEVHANLRETVYTEEKASIGRICRSMVCAGDTIFLDESTTCCAIAKELKSIGSITVFTNSYKIIHILEDCENVKLILTGGEFDRKNQCFVGAEVADFLKSYYVDKCFISCRGVDMNIGITDGNEKNGRVRKCIIRQAAEKILVIDKTKLNLKKFYKISGFEMIDKVVIDGFYSDEQRDIWEQFLNQTHTKLIVAK
ncbi:DeoR family transcriptional regulator [Frisingicoccus sp.]|uniref:DeoR/GlpR family DNA-binding transcription regulator n=1 Tax=Frisingicoccus sp. TaxID=1918627 RepID=UPI0015ADE13B